MAVEKIKRVIIAAVSENGYIGLKGKLPWNNRQELLHFKVTTINHPVIMGRLTYESLDNQLLNRLNIIISSTKEKEENRNMKWVKSLSEAYTYLQKEGYKKVFIIGGERIFRSAIKHADEMIISHMNFKVEGDKKFPKINFKKWQVQKELNYNTFVIKYYNKKGK